MPRPRKELVSIDDTPYYHVVSRCVRRAFLCGVDRETGHSYEHRRQWVEERIRLLSSLFAIDICAYAVMSNHLHIVVKLNPNESDHWSDTDVLKRWTSLFKGPEVVQKSLQGARLSSVEVKLLAHHTHEYRRRMGCLSWFMKCLNEPIAREANKEDGCTGHFWEGRFKSQALRTEKALLSCMAYVDLNPVRADIAETPEDSDHTSIKERLKPRFDPATAQRVALEVHGLYSFTVELKPLLEFSDVNQSNQSESIPFSFRDYLELVDYTGRMHKPRKRGTIASHHPPILERLKINHKDWIDIATKFERRYRQQFSRLSTTLR